MSHEVAEESARYGSGATIEKLDAHRRYADAYTTALRSQPSELNRFTLHYVDAFAGRGEVSLPGSAGSVSGSAIQAFEVDGREFDHLLLIDANQENCDRRQEVIEDRDDNHRATVKCGDANVEVAEFSSWLGGPDQRMDRAFFFVDPFAMQFSWEAVESIAATKRADMLMLFPLMAVRRNAKVRGWPNQDHQKALGKFYGDESWRTLYSTSGGTPVREGGDRAIVECYAERLRSAFEVVVDPQRTLGTADDGSLFTMLFAASNPRAADPAERIARGVFRAATGMQGRMRLE